MLGEVAAAGRASARDTILTGPRGVGKTVTMAAFASRAARQGFETVNLQAVVGHAGLVASLFQRAQARIAQGSGPWSRAKNALEKLSGIDLSVGPVSLGLSREHAGEAIAHNLDPGNLAEALSTLAHEFQKDQHNGGLLITVDELQAAAPADLALLAAALHRLNVDFPDAVVAFAATGLPRVIATLADAGVTHPDRLFAREQIPVVLEPEDATFAIVEPARRVGVVWEPGAVAAVVAATNGHPAHLQVVADAVWRAARSEDRITEEDAADAVPRAMEEIVENTIAPLWDKLSARQMEYITAVAVLGGDATTDQLTAVLGRPAQQLSWLRDELASAGDIYTPRRGRVVLAVPALGPFAVEEYTASVAGSGYALTPLAEMRRRAGARHAS
jgi:hypothetical protein